MISRVFWLFKVTEVPLHHYHTREHVLEKTIRQLNFLEGHSLAWQMSYILWHLQCLKLFFRRSTNFHNKKTLEVCNDIREKRTANHKEWSSISAFQKSSFLCCCFWQDSRESSTKRSHRSFFSHLLCRETEVLLPGVILRQLTWARNLRCLVYGLGS